MLPVIANVQESTMAPAVDASRVHVPALDGVRGIAILLVLCFHFPTPFAGLRPFTAAGWVGVDLFFVLSGYLITGILYSSINKPHYYRNFYARRSLRIFPLYYAFITLILLVLRPHFPDYWLGLDKMKGRGLEYFLYYADFSTVFIGWPPKTLGAFWSLSVEEHFYFFWPTFIKKIPKHRLLLISAMVGLAAALSRLAITGFHVTWLASYYLTTSRLDSLVVGAMVAIAVQQRPEWLRRWLLPISGTALVILAGIAWWRHGLWVEDWPMRTVGYTLIAIAFASVVWMAGNTKGAVSRVLSNSILRSFGKYSYCLYVVHLFVLASCERWLGPKLFPSLGLSGDAPLPLFILAMTLSFSIAWLSWRFYENPILDMKKLFTS